MASINEFTVAEEEHGDMLIIRTNTKDENCLLIEIPSRKMFGLTIPAALLFITGEVVGGGLVAIGNGVVNAGMIGVLFLILAALLNYVASIIFSWCFLHITENNPEMKRDSRKAYTNIIRVGLGNKAASFATALFHLFAASVTTIYLLISADLLSVFLKSLIPVSPMLENFRVWVAVYACVLYPLTLFGTPKEFWFIALVAVVTTMLSTVFISSKILIDSANGLYSNASQRELTVSSFFSGIGTILFAFCGVPFFPNIQADMRCSEHFVKASAFGYATILLVYFPVGIIAYFVIGDATAGDILKNAVQASDVGAIKVLPYASIILLSFHFIFAYILIFNAMAQEVEGAINIPHRFCWQRCLVRGCLVLLTLILAESIPDFNVLMSLCGGTLQVFLSFILPFCCYWKLKDHLPLWQKIGLIEMSIIILICLCGSVYASLINTIKLYSHH